MTSVKGRYARIEIPLDKAESGKELHISGDYLSIVSITGAGTCEIKLDHRHSQAIDFREITGFTGIFERLYFTSDGGGGACTIFVGTGMAIEISPDPEKIWSGGVAAGHVTAPTSFVQELSSESLKLEDVTIRNQATTYWCYIGPYNSDLTDFKAHAFRLQNEHEIKFSKVDMYALGCASHDGIHTVILHIIGRYE